jgi:hypothetical protein
MAKDPTFPFYAQDFLIDTLRWSRDMQGLHVCLLAESWANGGLPNENEHPLGLGSTDVQVWLKIKSKWFLKDDLWFNAKLEEVRAARESFREKQREKGILSGKKRNQRQTKPQPKANSGSTVVEPIESESEYESELKIKKEQIPKLELFEEIFTDELYIGELSRAHPKKNLKQAFEEMYIHHSQSPNILEAWQWRQKFNTWLTIKRDNNGNAKSKRESTSDLAAAFAERVSRDANGGAV